MLKAPVSPDSDLVEEIRRGEREAEAALFEKYAARVYYLALSELRSHPDAEDVRTETFLRGFSPRKTGWCKQSTTSRRMPMERWP
jgi:DNA-directed RNA polymerase specialized sigma24 family protein